MQARDDQGNEGPGERGVDSVLGDVLSFTNLCRCDHYSGWRQLKETRLCFWRTDSWFLASQSPIPHLVLPKPQPLPLLWKGQHIRSIRLGAVAAYGPACSHHRRPGKQRGRQEIGRYHLQTQRLLLQGTWFWFSAPGTFQIQAVTVLDWPLPTLHDNHF